MDVNNLPVLELSSEWFNITENKNDPITEFYNEVEIKYLDILELFPFVFYFNPSFVTFNIM